MACAKRLFSKRCYSLMSHLARGSSHRETLQPNILVKSQVIQRIKFSHKNYDIKNDPEIKSLLAEIESDFANVKGPKTEGADDVIEDNSVADSVSDEVRQDTESENSPKPNSNELKFENQSPTDLWTSPIGLQRGKEGVFDLDELLTFLEKENGQDIVVIDIPKEARFGDHMVLVSAVSARHLKSMSSHIKWIHKQRKSVHDDVLTIEGFETAPDWHAMDLGNIILHLFLPETRQRYDIESLWTNWGKPVEKQSDVDPYEIGMEDEFWKSFKSRTDDSDEKNTS